MTKSRARNEQEGPVTPLVAETKRWGKGGDGRRATKQAAAATHQRCSTSEVVATSNTVVPQAMETARAVTEQTQRQSGSDNKEASRR